MLGNDFSAFFARVYCSLKDPLVREGSGSVPGRPGPRHYRCQGEAWGGDDSTHLPLPQLFVCGHNWKKDFVKFMFRGIRHCVGTARLERNKVCGSTDANVRPFHHSCIASPVIPRSQTTFSLSEHFHYILAIFFTADHSSTTTHYPADPYPHRDN